MEMYKKVLGTVLSVFVIASIIGGIICIICPPCCLVVASTAGETGVGGGQVYTSPQEYNLFKVLSSIATVILALIFTYLLWKKK